MDVAIKDIRFQHDKINREAKKLVQAKQTALKVPSKTQPVIRIQTAKSVHNTDKNSVSKWS